jgi:hypothetical protein
MVPQAVRDGDCGQVGRIRSFTISDLDTIPYELLYPVDGTNENGFLAEQFPSSGGCSAPGAPAPFGWGRPASSSRPIARERPRRGGRRTSLGPGGTASANSAARTSRSGHRSATARLWSFVGNEIRRRPAATLTLGHGIQHVINWSTWRRHHKARAPASHHARQATQDQMIRTLLLSF